MVVVVRSVVFLLGFLFAFFPSKAHDPLEQIISYSFSDKDFESVLLELSDAGEFDFAFNPAGLNKDVLYSGDYDSARIGLIIKELCDAAHMKWSFKDDILLVKPKKTKGQDPINSTISGKVVLGDSPDYQTASIEGADLNLYGGTDSLGNYRLFLPVPEYPLRLKVYSPGYEEKTVHLNSRYQKTFYVRLSPDTTQEEESSPDIQKITLPSSGSDSAILGEITDYFPANNVIPKDLVEIARKNEFVREQTAQASLWARKGTNGVETGRYENNFSANLVTGYNAGIKGAEIGLINVNRFNVTGFQFGIIGNSTGGRVTGYQVGNFYNHCLLGTTGAQASWIYNESRFFVKGFQASLVNNIQGRLMGAQFGAVFNTVEDEIYGVQFGGLINLSQTQVNGAQIGGLANSAEEVNGLQASVINRARYLKGAQIGLFNHVKLSNGFQLGLVNVCDSLDGGYFGLMNFIRGGYVSLEFSYDETNFGNIFFRSGKRGFYTMFGGGVSNLNSEQYRVSGGIGRLNHLFKPVAIQTDLVYSAIGQSEQFYGHLGVFNLTLYLEFFQTLFITGGPTVSFFASNVGEGVINTTPGSTINADQIRPMEHQGRVLWSEYESGTFYQVWLGAKLSAGIVF